jgi:hypothetical protein
LIRFELDLLTKKEQQEVAVERRIDSLIAHREEELLIHDPSAGHTLKGIHKETDKLNAYAIEVEEAYTAGTKALDLVRLTESHLLEARQFGQGDIWGIDRLQGIGSLKHRSIDHAKEMAFQSTHALRHFTNEIRDVFRHLNLHFNMDIEEIKRFTDIFFDNLITDWKVQQKINKSLAKVSSTRQQVEDLVHQLNQERGIIKDKLDALEKQRTRVILDS